MRWKIRKTNELYHYGVKGMKWHEHRFKRVPQFKAEEYPIGSNYSTWDHSGGVERTYYSKRYGPKYLVSVRYRSGHNQDKLDKWVRSLPQSKTYRNEYANNEKANNAKANDFYRKARDSVGSAAQRAIDLQKYRNRGMNEIDAMIELEKNRRVSKSNRAQADTIKAGQKKVDALINRIHEQQRQQKLRNKRAATSSKAKSETERSRVIKTADRKQRAARAQASNAKASLVATRRMIDKIHGKK